MWRHALRWGDRRSDAIRIRLSGRHQRSGAGAAVLACSCRRPAQILSLARHPLRPEFGGAYGVPFSIATASLAARSARPKSPVSASTVFAISHQRPRRLGVSAPSQCLAASSGFQAIFVSRELGVSTKDNSREANLWLRHLAAALPPVDSMSFRLATKPVVRISAPSQRWWTNGRMCVAALSGYWRPARPGHNRSCCR